MARIAILGGGYVGLTTAVALAEDGHRVTVIDSDAAKVEAILAGHAPFHEPGLDAALKRALKSGNVRAMGDLAAGVRGTRFVFLAVGTPSRDDGSIDLGPIERATEALAEALVDVEDPPVVVVKSTVVPGTTEGRLLPILRKRLGQKARIAVNPEFLKEGSALADARKPDRIVIGTLAPGDATALKRLYRDAKARVFSLDPSTAEMVKYAANAFLALKVGFANEMANVCEPLGIDWYDVIEPMGADKRIGPLFLRAGAGFGGSCFPKDVRALAHEAAAHERPSQLLEALLASNEIQPLRTVEMLKEELGDLRGKRVALLGLAFKPETDDVRETRALPIWRMLVKEGADVVCHDPLAGENFRRLAPEAKVVDSAAEALKDADGCIVQTEWPEYRELRAKDFGDSVVVDGRRALDAERLRRSGVRVRALGASS